WICPAQREGLAFFQGKRFGQNKKTVERVRKAQSAGDPKRQARSGIAKQTCTRRAQDKSDPESRAPHSQWPRSFFRRDDIGSAGGACRSRRRRDPGNNAPEEEPSERRRQCHHDVIE